MKLKLSLLPVLIAIVTATALGQQPCKRHAEPLGKFSMCPPADWEVAAAAGQTYGVFVGPENSNINIQRALSVRVPLTNFVDGSTSYLLTHVKEQGADEIKVMSRVPFATNAGASGIKVTLEIKAATAKVISIQYFFDHPAGGKLTVTGTTDTKRRTIDEKLFDAAVRSLKFP